MLSDLLWTSAAVLLLIKTAAAQNDGTPCQIVSSMSQKYELARETDHVIVPAQVAQDCLKSVPLNQTEDLAMIEEMELYLHWQSNIAYLNDPPEGYTQDRADTEEAINKIKTDLRNGQYKEEFKLMQDLSETLARSYDFHFQFTPDISRVFAFIRGSGQNGAGEQFALVSISKDGKALPELYNYYDILNSGKEGWTPSPITEINNGSAEEYVQNWSKNSPYHEDHARYNKMFPSQTLTDFGNVTSNFGLGDRPDGANTHVKHKNGTVIAYPNIAVILAEAGAFEEVQDGESFFARFCNQLPSSGVEEGNPEDLVKRQSAPNEARGFPKAYKLHSENAIGAFFLEDQGYTDVAVLSVPTFDPGTVDSSVEWQDLVGDFLRDAKAAGKKKLVVDLRGNGGGQLDLGYDLFKQLFPTEDPYGASRFRANEAFDLLGQLLAEWLETNNITEQIAIEDYESHGSNSTIAGLYNSIFNYQLLRTIDSKEFQSWDDYFGPHVVHKDNFTSLSRFNLDDYFSGFDPDRAVTGYRGRTDKLNKDQPFKAEDIVLLQDGLCGSTCATFTEFMKTQGGVKQVVFGGKPVVGPMQGVAGSKGAQVWTWNEIHIQVATAYTAFPDRQQELDETEIGQLYAAQRPLARSAWNNDGSILSGVNLRDSVRKGDTSEIPLEFIYEAADCRIFYTADMIRNVTNVWKKTVDAHWGDAQKTCVEGSTGHASAKSRPGNVIGNGTETGNGNTTDPGTGGGGGGSGNGGKGDGDKKPSGAAGKMGISTLLLSTIVGLAGLFAML